MNQHQSWGCDGEKSIFDFERTVENLPVARGSRRGTVGRYGSLEEIYDALGYTRQFIDKQKHDEHLFLPLNEQRGSTYSLVS